MKLIFIALIICLSGVGVVHADPYTVWTNCAIPNAFAADLRTFNSNQEPLDSFANVDEILHVEGINTFDEHRHRWVDDQSKIPSQQIVVLDDSMFVNWHYKYIVTLKSLDANNEYVDVGDIWFAAQPEFPDDYFWFAFPNMWTNHPSCGGRTSRSVIDAILQ